MVFRDDQKIVLPTGATSGTRIELDGITGEISGYDSSDRERVEMNNGGFLVRQFPAPDPDNPPIAYLTGAQLKLGHETDVDYTTFYQDWEIVFQDLTAFSSALISRLGNNLRFRAATGGYINCQSFLRYSGEAWNDLTLPAGWAATLPAQYKRYPDGTVRLRGIINAVPNPIPGGTAIGPLPAGYRPAQDELFVIGFDSSATKGRAIVRSATGNIEIYDAPNDLPSLSGIQFDSVH